MKTVHEVLTILERHGHVYTLQLKPSMVGHIPLNRDGSGVNPVDVHELLSDIATAGWLDSRVTAVAVEPCSPEDFQWNLEYFQTTGGMLGTVDTSQLKATEAACRWSSWGSEIRPFTVQSQTVCLGKCCRKTWPVRSLSYFPWCSEWEMRHCSEQSMNCNSCEGFTSCGWPTPTVTSSRISGSSSKATTGKTPF